MVSAGSLGFSVMIFCILAVVCIAALFYRRKCGGELGAPTSQGRWGLFWFYMSLWAIFLLLSGLYDYGWIPGAHWGMQLLVGALGVGCG